MSRANSKAILPTNPTLKEINWYKKQINWGELPPFYHMVASSISETEGILHHGFDNAVKRVLDRRNWNLELLGGYEDDHGVIFCDDKPQVSLHQVFTERGYELWAFPVAKNVKVDKYMRDNRFLGFNIWDPHSMKGLLRINQLHKFIGFYFERGDTADKALILHAHKAVHKVISFLQAELNITSVDGVTIKDFYLMCEKENRTSSDEYDLARLKYGEGIKKE
ncbi:hypothetical protein [Pseudoalteromonas byunsanensis]|uniref:Uncharacterized protein n=1 Tax=Pseudoalteromonas byunsanensis TaxID=327939 RepID=A0A1S1N8U3_9GAMM|nr:hypothetical protein [Pseudoalteromonas byunsanensis]OHU95108.1 hypothetical protein BIW53_12655 [Pseudoalteromonas byunsanensis]